MRAKLMLMAIIPILLLAISVFFYFRTSAKIDTIQIKAAKADQIVTLFSELNLLAQEHHSFLEQRTAEQWASKHKELGAALQGIEQEFSEDWEQPLIKRILKSHQSAGYLFEQYGPNRRAEQMRRFTNRITTRMTQELLQVSTDLEQLRLNNLALVEKAQKRLNLLNLMLVTLMSLVAPLAAYMTYRSVAIPAKLLHDGMTAASKGNLSYRIRNSSRDEFGQIAAMFDKMADARQKNDEALRESERQLREMLESVQLAAVTLDANGAILFCNDFLLQLTGWRRVEIEGKSWFDLFIPKELDLRNDFRAYMDKGDVAPHYENEIVTRSGERRMIAWSNTLLKDSSGKVVGTTSIGEDITDRFKLEDALRQSQQTLRALVDSNPESLCLMDRDGRILVANRAFAHRLGRDADEIINQSVYKLLPAEVAKERKEKISKVFDTAAPLRFSDQHGLLIFDHHLHPAQVKDGKVLTVAVLSIDVTEQHMASQQLKRLNEELEGRVEERTRELTSLNQELKGLKEIAEHASKAKSDYLASMSHEIRTPINAIIGLGHLLLQEKLSPKQRDYLQKIDSATTSLLELINDILDLSKIESGKLTLENTDFSLRETVGQAVDIVSTDAQQKGLKLLSSIDEKVPDLLNGDQLRLRQVILNLVNNAVKFTNAGQVAIKISIDSKGGGSGKAPLVIEVSDTGIGMTQEQLSRLFSPFVQADRSTTRTHGGTGLGLSICKQLIEMMGGSIEASSVHGKGSKFIIRLMLNICSDPSRTDSIKESLSPGQRHKVLSGARILVVEDDPINQLVTREILSTAGVKVAVASNAAEALAAVENRAVNRIDAILVDIQLPDMDGYELTKKIKSLNGADRIPVIALTAHAMSGDRERCLAAGMNAHIAKPLPIEQLYVTLSELLAARIREESRVIETDELLFFDDSELPRIPGIAIGSALNRLNGNRQLLAQLIKLFAREHRTIPEEIDQLLREGDLATAQRLVHSLKGVAGNLSAERLYTSSSKMDAAIRAGNKADAVSAFAAFQQAMTELCDTASRIEELLGVTLDHQSTVTTTPPGELLQVALKLKQLLQAQDLAAATVSEHLKGLASSGSFSSMVTTVDDEIKCLNYREALKHLAKLISSLEAPVMEGE